MNTEIDDDKSAADAKKRGRGRPTKADGLKKRDIRCSLTDEQMDRLNKVRHPYEKTIASFVSKAVREEMCQREKIQRNLNLPIEQLRIMETLNMYVIDQTKLQLINLILNTDNKSEMHQKLLHATSNQYASNRRI